MDDENWENTFLEELTAAEGEAEDASQEMDEEDDEYTVKTFGLLQPYFGCLSCMPAVYVIHYKLQLREATNLILNQSVVEKLLPLN